MLLMSIHFCLVQCKERERERVRERECEIMSDVFYSIFSRLALPICLFYLYMIQVVRLEYNDDDTDVPQTAFALVSNIIINKYNSMTIT